MTSEATSGTFGGALVRAAIAYAEQLASPLRSRLSASEIELSLGRLGLRSETGSFATSGDGSAGPAVSAAILPRLRAEVSRQVRWARAGHPRYDLNRHIAVHRLVAALDPRPGPPRRPVPHGASK